jgi:type III restriction enzyme
LCKQTSLFSSHATLYGHIKRFVQSHLFGREIDLENPNTLRNLAELAATKTILDTFTKAINDVTISDRGSAEVVGSISLMETRPFMAKQRPFLVAKRSVFNRIIGDLGFELKFAEFLEQCPDVISFAKNYQSIGFKLDYAKDNGDLSSYTPDFIVKSVDDTIVIVETKGQVDVDVPHKMRRLAQWVEDVNSLQENQRFEFVFVDEDGFETYRPKSLASLLGGFREYKL